MIVVDTNVICYLLMPGERTAAAERLFREEPEWIAPRLWLDELLNVLATYERQCGRQSNRPERLRPPVRGAR